MTQSAREAWDGFEREEIDRVQSAAQFEIAHLNPLVELQGSSTDLDAVPDEDLRVSETDSHGVEPSPAVGIALKRHRMRGVVKRFQTLVPKDEEGRPEVKPFRHDLVTKKLIEAKKSPPEDRQGRPIPDKRPRILAKTVRAEIDLRGQI
ncbi:TPA: hypothetical protein DIS56_03330 [Candidatus Saccharibacteria bacterium]|nr:MAG: hypothetical protein UX30_C0003G0054 [Candidatus Saccharibacteria bacterium GW2011_GWA2_46_10]OGL34354.1 MAG: hypothetical protein A3F05_02275 [Candidatus Saccharibacteria bacterium RIFCSPHIGHO2_12_FULL_47_17]HCM52134.1 hypothetical protein [Candidatus Saccharibacteria bacterium]